MKEIKDTLGIKYEKYTSIYNLEDEKVGILLKYLMWENGKDVILKDVSELTKKRIEKKSKEIEEKIEKMLDDAVFEIVFNEMTQQVKRSHRCWQQLKDNLEKNKNNNKEEAKEKTKTTTKTKKEETTTTETTTTEETQQKDYSYNEEGYVILSEKAYEEITKQGLNAEDIEDYMIANIEDFNNDYLTILDVLAQYKGEMLLS